MLIGIIFVIIFLSILILVHEFGHFWVAKKFGLLVEEFGIGLPPKIWSKKIGETVYSVNALPLGGFVKIFGENADQRGLKRSFTDLKIWKRSVIIAAGVLMNFLLGWLVISIIFSIGIPQTVLITEVQSDSPAAGIGLQIGDKIIGFSNVEKFINFIDAGRGQEIVLKIERNGEIKEFKTIPRINPPSGEGALGVGLIEAGLPKQNLLASFWEGLKTSVETVKMIFIALFNLIAKAFVGKASLEQIAGPIGIVKVTAQASTLGFVYLLQLLALISLNLAVINLLPFPALDGGRLLFLLIEKIKGEPLPEKFEKYANAVGMALLLLLMIIITIKDISRL
ncbi:MAG: RIP metalloprotease RseP [bacterium]|nr:RIP metalloprotease RseP [bacterium]